MSKVMIVEDDDSLREIYSIRLTAEGYAVISARDGEEALAVAVKERPDLIISDVMMPKITGFDMLDILRSTPETANIRVIMMTALSSEDQRTRGENLGADRYLVKSQVGIEDVVNTVHEVLGDRNAGGVITPAASNPLNAPVAAQPLPAAPAAPSVAAPVATQPISTPTPQPVAPPAQPSISTPQPIPQTDPAQPAAMPQPPVPPFPTPEATNPIPPSIMPDPTV